MSGVGGGFVAGSLSVGSGAGGAAGGLAVERGIAAVVEYLRASNERSAQWLAERDRAFRDREREFKVLMTTSNVYKDVVLKDNCEALDGLHPDSRRRRREAAGGEGGSACVDPYFDKNVITDWVKDGKAKELYIPLKYQHPYTEGKTPEGTTRKEKKERPGATTFPKVHANL